MPNEGEDTCGKGYPNEWRRPLLHASQMKAYAVCMSQRLIGKLCNVQASALEEGYLVSCWLEPARTTLCSIQTASRRSDALESRRSAARGPSITDQAGVGRIVLNLGISRKPRGRRTCSNRQVQACRTLIFSADAGSSWYVRDFNDAACGERRCSVRHKALESLAEVSEAGLRNPTALDRCRPSAVGSCASTTQLHRDLHPMLYHLPSSIRCSTEGKHYRVLMPLISCYSHTAPFHRFCCHWAPMFM
ncbi:hypothetical protein BJ546DRAFT_240489 [Cryomyces antarcticus]